jgi:hypothetical protein
LSDTANAAAAPEASPAADATPVSVPAIVSSREASGLLGKMREKAKAAPPVDDGAPDDGDAPAQESPARDDDAAPEEVRGETDDQANDPVETPPIEPPRSWTKEQKERFATFPPEVQQQIAETEQRRETDFLQRQQKVSEAAKAAEAERQQLLQQRQQYEQALPSLIAMLSEQQAGEFGDIKTWDDVQKLADEDLPRYLRWEVHQKRMTALQAEMQNASARKQQEEAQAFQAWSQQQDALFGEKAKEFSNPQTAAKAREEIVSYLGDIGVSADEMAALWSGKSMLSLRDARAQLIVRDAAKYRAAQSAAKEAARKAAPPAQRPGVAPQRGEATREAIQNLSRKLESTGRDKDAVALLKARRRA